MMARTKWIFGGQSSAPPQDTKPPPEPVSLSADAKKFGLENFGNTCYANSVLQALYFCSPFRDLIIQTSDPSIPQDIAPSVQDAASKPSPVPLVPVRRKPERKPSSAGGLPDTSSIVLQPLHPIPSSPPTLFSALRSLFLHISTHPGDKGTVAPKAFIDKLKESKEDFRSTMHQDAHEFLNHLLNMIVEEIEGEKKSGQNNVQGEDLSSSLATLASKAPPTIVTATSSNSGTSSRDATLVHKLFEGALTSETRCLTCETISSRDESFLDLSIDIEQNSSVTACLRSFSASEMLCQRNKFFCDACCDLQEAEKRMKIKSLPNVLALHLKRFKFQEDVQKYIKLTYRVAFPFQLKLFNTVDDLANADRLYNLFAIVVHIGNGPHHGHYISIVRSAGSWLVFDDDNVYPISEGEIPKYYGDSNSGSAYVLYYQAADIDLVSLGLQPPKVDDPPPIPEPASQSTSAQPQTPSQHGYPTPSLPPGLITETEEANVNEKPQIIVPSSPVVSPAYPTSASDKSHYGTPRLSLAEPPSSQSDSGGTPGLPLGGAPPLTPSSSRGILSPIRRSASSSVRPSTATTTSHDKSNKSLHSDLIRSPLHSASSPSLPHPEDSSSVPPVPPIPSLTPTTPISAIAQTNGKAQDKEDKDKDKSRKETKGGGWFKRKSFRIGEKPSKQDDETLLSSSPRNERPTSSSWFKASSQPKRRPSIAAASENPGKAESRLSAQLETPRAISTASSNASSMATHHNGFSSSGPSILSASPPTTVSSPPPVPLKSSPSSSKSSQPNEVFHSPPPRTSSLVPALNPRSGLTEQKGRSMETTLPIATPPARGLSHGIRELPLVPNRRKLIPDEIPSFNVNGQGSFVSEPESIYQLSPNGHVSGLNSSQPELHSMSVPTSSPHGQGTLHRHHPSLVTPMSVATPIGYDNSISSTMTGESAGAGSATNAPAKRATRKLSLTAPKLGLGKRDKDKDKDKEARKEKNISSSFMNRFDPRI